MDPQRNITRAFSLIEILVVIGIALILVGITLPAFTHVVRGTAVEIGARTLSSQLAIARAEAITRRCKTALLMYGRDFDLSGTDDQDGTYGYASMRVAILNNDGDFQEWLPNSQWVFLPQGCLIASVEDDPAVSILLESKTKTVNGRTVTYYIPKETPPSRSQVKSADTNWSNDSHYRAVVFLPAGQCTSNMVLNLCEGISDSEDGDGFIRENFSNCLVQKVNRYTGLVSYLFNGRLEEEEEE